MKLTSKTLLTSAICAAALLATGAQASSVVINKDLLGTPANVPGLTGFTTMGSQMAGMMVTAVFSLAGSQTLAWQTTGATSGGVSGAGWGLRSHRRHLYRALDLRHHRRQHGTAGAHHLVGCSRPDRV
jgi:hypothetical protein